jgi:hypothetical protein
MREEYLAQFAPHARHLPSRLHARYQLQRLRYSEALAAVVQPLKSTTRRFAPDAAEALVRSMLAFEVRDGSSTRMVEGEFVEPVHLQVACKSLWHALPDDVTVIDEASVRGAGDVDAALASYYETCISELVKKRDANERSVRTWFDEELITADGTRALVHRGADSTGGIPNVLIDRLEAQHLVRPEMRGDARWYELTHDRFIQPIRRSNQRWREALAESSAFGFALELRAKNWNEGGRRVEQLLEEQEFTAVERWLRSDDGRAFAFSPSARDYLEKSRDASTLAEEKEKRAKLLAAVLGLGVLVAIAFRELIRSQGEKRELERGTMVERGELASFLAKQAGLEFDALVMGLRAVAPAYRQQRPAPEVAVEGLRTAVARLGDRTILEHKHGAPESIALDEKGRTVLTWGPRAIYLWSAETGWPIAHFEADAREYWSAAALSTDGRVVLAVARPEETDSLRSEQSSSQSTVPPRRTARDLRLVRITADAVHPESKELKQSGRSLMLDPDHTRAYSLPSRETPRGWPRGAPELYPEDVVVTSFDQEEVRIELTGASHALASLDGARVAISGERNEENADRVHFLVLADPRSGEVVCEFSDASGDDWGTFAPCAFSSDSATLAYLGSGTNREGQLVLTETKTGKLIATGSTETSLEEYVVELISFANEGRNVVLVYQDFGELGSPSVRAQVFDASNARQVATWENQLSLELYVQGADWMLVERPDDDSPSTWNLTSGEVSPAPPTFPRGGVRGLFAIDLGFSCMTFLRETGDAELRRGAWAAFDASQLPVQELVAHARERLQGREGTQAVLAELEAPP